MPDFADATRQIEEAAKESDRYWVEAETKRCIKEHVVKLIKFAPDKTFRSQFATVIFRFKKIEEAKQFEWWRVNGKRYLTQLNIQRSTITTAIRGGMELEGPNLMAFGLDRMLKLRKDPEAFEYFVETFAPRVCGKKSTKTMSVSAWCLIGCRSAQRPFVCLY